jgi:hypothetical protein
VVILVFGADIFLYYNTLMIAKDIFQYGNHSALNAVRTILVTVHQYSSFVKAHEMKYKDMKDLIHILHYNIHTGLMEQNGK